MAAHRVSKSKMYNFSATKEVYEENRGEMTLVYTTVSSLANIDIMCVTKFGSWTEGDQEKS